MARVRVLCQPEQTEGVAGTKNPTGSRSGGGRSKNKKTKESMKMKTLVVINEQHKLLEVQQQILNKKFENWEFLKVPANGWTLEDIKEIENKLKISQGVESVVFVSPIPVLIANLSFSGGFDDGFSHNPNANHIGDTPMVFVFHNDKRKKIELPDGRIINKIADDGWQLINPFNL